MEFLIQQGGRCVCLHPRAACVYDGGGEGTSAKEENGGREWLSAAAMTVDGGVTVGFLLYFMACAVKNK